MSIGILVRLDFTAVPHFLLLIFTGGVKELSIIGKLNMQCTWEEIKYSFREYFM